MRSPRLQLLSLFLTAAVIVLGAATIMHVHGVSDPHAHHTPADFMLQFQTLLAVLLPWIAFLAHLGPAACRVWPTLSGYPLRQFDVAAAAPRGPPTFPP
jgi:hypothetical protein